MKHLVITALVALTGFGAQAQVKETRQAYNVTKIDVKSGIEVVFVQADSAALTVETNRQGNFTGIVTEYSGNTLKIYMKEPEDRNTVSLSPVRVYIAQPGVTSFKAAGGSVIRVAGTLQLPDVTISLASGATFTASMKIEGTCNVKVAGGAGFRGIVNTDTFKGDAIGGAFIKLAGSANTAEVFCSGGSLQAGKFMCQKADVLAKNASSAFINAATSIRASADNSSSITYYGDPVKIDIGTNAYAVKRDNYKFSLN